ncbi:MAG: TetR/AcrR family transcriptional regulator [Oscillospiraceae bacterium]|nr:TetR/AcrR family transcriptional regulator [Oscillospiraceae bacterium]
MKQESRRVRMTKALLRNSLVELMQTQNIRQITIKSICEQADVNRSTFYLYYGSQYELLDDIKAQVLADTAEILQAEHARRGQRTITDEDLLRLLELHLTYVKENIRFFKAFSNDQEDYLLPMNSMHLLLDSYVAQLAADQHLNDKLAQRMFIFMEFGCIGTVKDWIAHDAAVTSPQALDQVIACFIKRVGQG